MDDDEMKASLHAGDRPFSDLMNDMPVPCVMLDVRGRVMFCNEHLLRLTGWSRAQMIGRDWFALVPWSETRDVKSNFAAALAEPRTAWHRENEVLTMSGSRRRMRWSNIVLRSDSGEAIGTASIGADVTQLQRGETRIKQLNRVHAVLSGVNALIVRVRDRDELFREACRIAFKQGEFLMSMVCIADPAAGNIVAAASAGMDAELQTYVRNILLSTDQSPTTIVAQSIREQRTIVVNDSRKEPRVLFGAKLTQAGVRSVAVLPLTRSQAAVGAFALYAGEVDFFQEEEIKLLTDLTGNISFALGSIDQEKKLNYLAYYDVLTGLANRSLLLERLELFKGRAAAGGYKMAVFLLDLERFRNINDSLGRHTGDELLKQVAEWLTGRVGDTTLLARVGADQFALVLPQVMQEGDVTGLLERTVESLPQQVFRLNDTDFRIGAKVGAALLPDDGADAVVLMKNAEAALKRAKARGDRFLFYADKMTAMVAGKLTLENQLRQALERSEFVLHYQPKVSLASGKLTGAEGLIRWNDPRSGLVPPANFIPILEETGMIFEVGRWALQQAVSDYLRWRKAGLPAVRIAVNVSPLQLRHRGFVAEIGAAISGEARAADGLEVEITESLIMEDVSLSIASLQAVRAMGVRVAIDDFGTGFSSLSYLHKLPVDALKIDRSFVAEMTLEPEGLALVSTIINLARWLKLTVVAEGVETGEQSRLLRLLSCDEMQGFIFSRPIPVEAFEKSFLLEPAPSPP